MITTLIRRTFSDFKVDRVWQFHANHFVFKLHYLDAFQSFLKEFYDIADLSTISRTVVFVCLGILLLIISFR